MPGSERFVPAEPKHIDEIARIEALSYPEDEMATKEGIAFRMKEAPEFFLAAEGPDGEILGFVNGTLCKGDTLTHDSMSAHSPDGSLLCIHSVVVEDSGRRKGLGTRILKEYVERVRALKSADGQPRVKRIALLCKEHLKGFYAGGGFELLGPSRVVHGKDQWFEMQLKL